MRRALKVNRALEYSLSGELRVPGSGDKSGHFSAENWGDYSLTTEKDGETVVLGKRRATVCLSTIEKKVILDLAKGYMSKKGANKVSTQASRRQTIVMADEDEILNDPEDDE